MQPVESCCAANFYATLKALFFIKIALKLNYFSKKMQNFRALEAPPPDPRASGSWGLCPRPPASSVWGLLPQTPKTVPPIANSWLLAYVPVLLPLAIFMTK